MRKIIFVIMLMLISIPVYALEASFYYDQERVEEMWVTQSKDGKVQSAHPYKLKRRSDNTYVYCIQPLTKLTKDLAYQETSDYTKLGLTKQQVDNINLIAYYGYGYGNHTTNVWYGVTQYLIWKEVGKGIDIYFTDKKNGTKKDLYTKEINEIKSLIAKHNLEPNFLKKYVLTTNQELVVDSNIDLNDYTIETDLAYKVKDNKIIFESANVGNYDVKLIKKNNRYKTSFVMYYSSSSQNLFLPGYSAVQDKEYILNLSVLEGKILLHKESKDKRSNLKGAEYGVYQDGKLITKIVTNDKGIGETTLPFGEYSIKELVAPLGYKLDPKEYKVVIDENNLEITLNLYDDKEIIKVPNTQSNDYKDLSLCSIIVGMIGIIYGKKKYYMY